MKKNIKVLFLTVVVALMLILGVICLSADEATTAATVTASGTTGDLTWVLTDDGVLTISGEGDMPNYSHGAAPWLGMRSNIREIVIEDGITSIGTSAFYNCYSLTSIAIPNSVISIGDWAIYYCNSLTNIIIPNSVVSIGKYAFSYCSTLNNIIIPDGVESISDYLFFRCESLNNIIISESVTNIGDYAFGETGFDSFTIPNSVINIGIGAFARCRSLTTIIIPNSITSISEQMFDDCESLTSIYIPNSVISIGRFAFWHCESLTSIHIPNSVISIGMGAFSDCSALTSINIPDRVVKIGDRTFSDCSALTSINIPHGVTNIGERAFYRCNKLKTVYYSSSKTVWEDITIDSGNDELLNADIVFAKFEVIEDGRAGNLAWELHDNGALIISGEGDMPNYTLDASEGVEVGFCSAPWFPYHYILMYDLNKIIIEDGVTSIGDYAFLCCFDVTEVIIPASVTRIGDNAFSGCDDLKIVHYSGSRVSWEQISIGTNNSRFTTAKLEFFHADGTDHDYIVHEAKAPTCTEFGYNEYVTCSRCEYSTYEEIVELGHDEVIHEAKLPACTEFGYNEYVTCSRCEYSTYEEIAELGHDEVIHEAKLPTCTEYGWNEYVSCTRCDYTTYEKISALGHTPGDSYCSVCGSFVYGFATESDGTRYYYADGSYAKSWATIDGKTYRFDPNTGILYTEPVLYGANTYYFNPDYSTVEGIVYEDGGMRFYKKGVRQYGWVDFDGDGKNDTYFFVSSQLRCEEDRVLFDGKDTRRFFSYNEATGFMEVVNGFYTDDRGTQFFKNGLGQYGWITSEGVSITDKPGITLSDVHYFAYGDGLNFYMVKDAKKTIGGVVREFDENNLVKSYTGWATNKTTGNANYYIEGVLQQGWCETPDGWVYLSRSENLANNITYGDVFYGWRKIGGKVYYFRASTSTPAYVIISDPSRQLTYDGVRSTYYTNQKPANGTTLVGSDYYITNPPAGF